MKNSLISQFPILERSVNGCRLVYLDNAATSQKPLSVIKASDDFYLNHNANVHRAIHTLSAESTTIYEGARKRVSQFINAPERDNKIVDNIVFSSGTTASFNLLAEAWGSKNLKDGDEIIISISEHHSNIVPWQIIAAKNNCKIFFVGVDANGCINLEELKKLLTAKTKLVSFTMMSNVLGVYNNFEEIRSIIGSDIKFAVDAAQAVAHIKIDVEAIDCDFLAFSAHKMYGPTGVGILYIRRNLMKEMSYWQGGGDMISSVTTEGFSPAPAPARFEAGTPNFAAISAFVAAIDFMQSEEFCSVLEEEHNLVNYAFERMKNIDGLEIYSPQKGNMGVISFNVKDVHAHDITHFLDQNGIALRSGVHCAQPLLASLGVTASCRASFACYNTNDDVDLLIEKLELARSFFCG